MRAQLSKSLTQLLEQVSRSFYLTLRILPGAIRPPIGLAYLLARTTDTVADTEIIPLDRRRAALAGLRESIQGRGTTAVALEDWLQHQGRPAERRLLERHAELLAALERSEPNDRQRIRDVLATIVSGQELDLIRFANASAEQIVALATDSELTDYTYRVAGCVGEFWTRMCLDHLFVPSQVDAAFLLANGVRFGQGLQLVNILRDVPADLRLGRCYLPLERLAICQLRPADLLSPAKEPAFRSLYHDYLDQAQDLLAAGWAYTNALPRSAIRVRLACAWPILIGVRTLERLRVVNALEPGQPVKIRRAELRSLMIQTVVLYPWPKTWQGLFDRHGT